jgi:hypothetical protein
VLDLLPLVYRFLHKEAAVGAAAAAAAAAAGAATAAASGPAACTAQAQQQQLGTQPAAELSSPAGEFMGMLLSLLTRPQEAPTHLAVVVDVPGATYRRVLRARPLLLLVSAFVLRCCC